MILVSKSPYRISLLGGGTDLDWFVKDNKIGLALGFSINAYSTIILKKRSFSQKGILNYSSREEYSSVDNISHPIIRSCLQRFSLDHPLELFSIGDNLSGGGLGSSSSFSVALINGICSLKNISISNLEKANIACEIEINDLGNPIGRQDQYLSAVGGINLFEFNNKMVVNKKLPDSLKEAVLDYSKKLYLIDTNLRRNASKPLQQIKDDSKSFSMLKKILCVAEKFIEDSRNKKKNEIIFLLDKAIKESWNIKKEMEGVLNNRLIEFEKNLNSNGIEVLKLLGAGSGGYFLVKIDKDFSQITEEFQKSLNIKIHNFDIEFKGLEILAI